MDPGLYSRMLMKFAKEATAACDIGPTAPQQLLEVAYLATTARGSSTACIVCLENEQLHASNLGDSGAALPPLLLLLRNICMRAWRGGVTRARVHR